MAEGVKLYKHFVEQIGKMGKIKRAWFTTFNLDISFFERYILSALMGMPFADIKSPYDYEALSANLANEPESLDEDKMEVKVFYDYRALLAGSKPKQTSVHLYPIDIKQLSGLNPELKFNQGVFHPKVILIETYTGEYWLMVSSANLTFGGWSGNREGFFCEKVIDQNNARRVREFFSNITASIKSDTESPLPQRIMSGSFPKEKEKWYFFSSFNSEPFLDQLNYLEGKLPLRLWSPYFADDLPDLIDHIQIVHFDKIEIIPAKNENQKIRITEKSYKESIIKDGVSFKQEKLQNNTLNAFAHAKVWLTPKALAIGSWNMTRAGMNISYVGNNNVEAGIIYELGPKEYKQVFNDYSVSALKSPEHFKQDELNEEKKDLLDKFSFTIDLVADWDKLQLRLYSPGYSKLIKQIDPDSFIRLPGFGEKRVQLLENAIDFRSFTKIFLTDRFFEIGTKNGNILYKGYIREIGLASRPIKSFENLDDYLKGWVLERPEDKEEMHRLPYPVEDESGDEFSDHTKKILFASDQNAWYTSFHAFQCIVNRIDQTKDLYAKERVSQLKRIGRVLPGSLSELKAHLETLLKTYLEDRSNFLKSPIYLWFLIEKANFVFSYFNNAININSEFIRPIKNLKLKEALSESDLQGIGEENFEKWRNYIVNKLKS
jgi:hypothetical protein